MGSYLEAARADIARMRHGAAGPAPSLPPPPLPLLSSAAAAAPDGVPVAAANGLLHKAPAAPALEAPPLMADDDTGMPDSVG